MMAYANERIRKQIMRKVSSMLLKDLSDPRLKMVTITRVELTRDRTECKVFWSSLEEGGTRSAIAHALEDAQGFVQREVAGILNTRVAPHLVFRFDPSMEGIERMSRILRAAREEDTRNILSRGELPDEEPADVDNG